MNIKRFREVLAFIEAYPHEWNQSGCYSCFIAHAANMASGYTNHHYSDRVGADFLEVDYYGPLWAWIVRANRTLDDFRTVARRVYA